MYDLYDLYDLAPVAGWEPYNLHDLSIYKRKFAVLDLYLFALPAHPLATAAEEPQGMI